MNRDYIDRLNELNKAEFTELIATFTEEDRLYAESRAREILNDRFGRKVYVRGLIEFTNICRNNCYYCGIRAGNPGVVRFRLTEEQIMDCCRQGYEVGLRTFVLQGGEDPYFGGDDEGYASGGVGEDCASSGISEGEERLLRIVSRIRNEYPDCAITLSVGERSRESYERLKEAGANRYLLRHETANAEHYGKLHPEVMSHANRMRCLRDLKELGYQTGCGIMVGSPYQTAEHIAEDMIYMREFQPEMVGIGPFLPQSATPFRDEPAGSVELTLFLLSLVRIMLPDVMLPSTTALGSAEADGRIRGILAGANVIMPNLSPQENRDRYLLYDGKAGLRDDVSYVLAKLKETLAPHGYEVALVRGDYGDNASADCIFHRDRASHLGSD